ncbi:putative transporter [Colletotrichum siamense]|uniref:putative transporter n=1 Tax=Colletotrichum siamense TaxID=690259 RepID=UPI001872C3F1|nr:putative transporter [Colletotrichum siamense]KAF5492122.1 putative transporter [Colletotrichum siamense]
MAAREAETKQEAMQATSDHIDSTLPGGEKDFVSEKDVNGDDLGMSEEEYAAVEKSLTRKLDFTLVPVVWILYLFNYLDRNNIAQARLSTFEKDLGLTGNQFNVAGAMYLLSCWYPRKELAFRTAILYSGVLLATAFSGLIAAGVLSGLEGARGIAGWQWLFIIEGAGSFAAAILGAMLLPDFPGQKSGVAKWLLTDKEQKVAVERIRRDRVSLPEADSSVWNGLKLAVKDARTWVFVVMLTANHSAYGFNNFFPTIVKGFKLGNNTLTLILTAPPYLLATVVAFLTAFSSDRRKERGFHISVPQGVACIGFIISVSTINNAARYVAAFLYICGCFSSNAMVFSWASSTLNQTPEKRACATAIINLLSQLGNIWSPYFFPSTDSPRYVMANLLMMASSALSIVTCAIMKVMLTRANKKLKAEGRDTNLFTL